MARWWFQQQSPRSQRPSWLKNPKGKECLSAELIRWNRQNSPPYQMGSNLLRPVLAGWFPQQSSLTLQKRQRRPATRPHLVNLRSRKAANSSPERIRPIRMLR